MPFTPRLILVTAAGLDEARSLARTLLERRLAACVNILPGIESHYHWRGAIEKTNEVLMLIKSSAEQFEALSAVIKEKHSYDCPEIVAIKPEEMSAEYRAWWQGACEAAVPIEAQDLGNEAGT